MNQGSEPDDVMTSAEAAAFLKVGTRTVIEEAKRGRLPGRRVGKGWRFSRAVLEQSPAISSVAVAGSAFLPAAWQPGTGSC